MEAGASYVGKISPMRYNFSSRYGASSPMTISRGTIGDLYTFDKRGSDGADFGMEPPGR